MGNFLRNYGATASTGWLLLIVLVLAGCGQTPQQPPEVFHEEHPAAAPRTEEQHAERNERKRERREERREAKRESSGRSGGQSGGRSSGPSGDSCGLSRSSAIHAGADASASGASGFPGAGAYDLQRDEQLGGHTLRKHVGRTDDQLRERLEQEPHISAASTWTNSQLAEETVGAALRDQAARISQWEARGERRPNLALHYEAGREIGRSLPRGASQTVPCSGAVIVLKANGGDGFYVLTTYPEAGR